MNVADRLIETGQRNKQVENRRYVDTYVTVENRLLYYRQQQKIVTFAMT